MDLSELPANLEPTPVRGAPAGSGISRVAAARWLALLALTVGVLYLCWLIISPFVFVVLWSTVLAIVSYPLFLRLRRNGYGKNLSAFTTTATVVLAILVPSLILGLVLFNWATDAAPDFQSTARTLVQPESPVYKFVDRFIDLDRFASPEFIAERLAAAREKATSVVLGSATNVLGGAVQMALVVLTLFYIIRDADRILPAVRKLMPMDEARSGQLMSRMYEVLTASLLGVLLIAAIQATLGGVGMWLLGIPGALLWSIVMFVASMIPMVGAGLVWGPAAIYLAISGAWVKAIILAVWGIVVVGMADNLLRPILVGKRARLHELVIFFSVLGGLQVFGILGLIVGPVVAAVAESLLFVIGRSAADFTDDSMSNGSAGVDSPSKESLASSDVAGILINHDVADTTNA